MFEFPLTSIVVGVRAELLIVGYGVRAELLSVGYVAGILMHEKKLLSLVQHKSQ